MNACFPCSPNCLECHLYNWNEECLYCEDGYGLTPYYTCEQGQSGCFPGTYEKRKSDGTFECKYCVDVLDSCDICSSATVCISCYPPFTLVNSKC